jgi:hypothetical protein
MSDLVPGSQNPADAAASQLPQFSLAELLLWMAGASVCLAAVYWLGCLGFAIATLGLITYVPYRAGLCSLMESGAVGLALASVIACMAPVGIHSREAARRSQCSNHLKQLGFALQNYHDTYGSFPPAYLTDAQGQPMHSWRVLLLPFVEEEALYKQYRFDEPWNGPNNSKLHDQMPRIFGCPSDKNSYSDMTSYLAVVGPNTAWPGEQATSMKDVTDAVSDTLLLAEARDTGIHWLEPRDFHVTQIAPTINPERGQGISSGHKEGAYILLIDCSVRYLADDLPADQLEAILSIAGGETVSLP